MALRIQPRVWKNADGSLTHTWRLIVEDYSTGERVCSYPPKQNYFLYGLNPSDPIEVARKKLVTVRERNKADRILERRQKIDKRLKEEAILEGAYLPKDLYNRFLPFLMKRRMWDKIPDGVDSHLRCMRRLILALGSCPSTWSDSPEDIFNWFKKQKYSLSYVEKVLPFLNLYGYFYCREFQKAWLPIPAPRGENARRIDDANHEHRDGKTKASKPMTRELLSSLVLVEEQYRWIRWSFYMGLRPSEVDRLQPKYRGKIWDIGTDPNGKRFLAVYQPKLVKIPRPKRWKRIPALLPEQHDILDEVHRGLSIRRPVVKTLQEKLGEGFGLYTGRKGFERLMRTSGQSFVNISRMLGHQDLGTTERNYREDEAVLYD